MTHRRFAEQKLATVCEGLGVGSLTDSARRVFATMSEPWSDWPLGREPVWENDITDDGTPFEFSAVFRKESSPRIRLLLEPQDEPLTAESSWQAGLRLNARLSNLGADLSRVNKVRDLFAPRPGLTARFSMWHAANIEPDGATFKLYLNPQIAGPRASTSIVERALSRLGMNGAVEFLKSRRRLRQGRDRLLYFALDLSTGPSARVKVYVAHHGANAEDIDAELADCVDSRPGDASRWSSALLGTAGAVRDRPILTCFAFSRNSEAPRATIHFPVRCYAPSDLTVIERAAAFLSPDDAVALHSTLEQMAERPLATCRGTVTYLSLRRNEDKGPAVKAAVQTSGESSGLEVTAYIAPQAYAFEASARACAI